MIQRAYEEGEEELLDDAEDAEDSKDEKTFLMDESLEFRSLVRDGEAVFAWKDLSGVSLPQLWSKHTLTSQDPGDVYEFVCDPATKDSEISTFQIVAVQCQYERKYKKSHENASEEDLEQFTFSYADRCTLASRRGSNFYSESPVPPASPLTSPTKSSTSLNSSPKAAMPKPTPPMSTLVAPPAQQPPRLGKVLAEEEAELHLYDISTGSFVLQDSDVVATVTDIGNWQCKEFSQAMANENNTDENQIGCRLRATQSHGLDLQ